MKIALITDNFYPEIGGIQDSVMLLARELGARGHVVRIYAAKPREEDFAVAHLPVGEIDLGASVSVERVPAISVPSPTQQSRLVIPTFSRWRRLKAFAPDIVHTHGFFGLGLEALRVKRALRVPLVGTNHWAISEFGTYTILNASLFARMSIGYVVWYYNHCSFVSGPSESVLTEMAAHGLTAPHEVVSNPIDTKIFRPVSSEDAVKLKKKLGFSGHVFIYAGRFGVEKNIDVLVRALLHVCKEIPTATLALAGHGSDRPRLESLARNLSVADRVRFLGTLSKRDLAEAYQASEVFAIASTSETQSMVLLQAMNCGIPAVAVKWRSFEEYVPADTGLLVTPGDSKAFAAKLIALFRDSERRSRMGQQAALFAQKFSAESIAEHWENIYAMHCDSRLGSTIGHPSPDIARESKEEHQNNDTKHD